MAPATAVLWVQFDRIGDRQYNNAIVTMIDVGLEELRVLVGTEAVSRAIFDYGRMNRMRGAATHLN